LPRIGISLLRGRLPMRVTCSRIWPSDVAHARAACYNRIVATLSNRRAVAHLNVHLHQ
jgi:hypothetical protein